MSSEHVVNPCSGCGWSRDDDHGITVCLTNVKHDRNYFQRQASFYAKESERRMEVIEATFNYLLEGRVVRAALELQTEEVSFA